MPNVSLCEQDNEVHYNPYVPPQPIAPVGKVQVFANPQCTEYADGNSDTVWVRVNQDFEYDSGYEWGSAADSRTYLNIGAGIMLWIDWLSTTDAPYTSGQVIECVYVPQWFSPQNNPQVIFE